MSCPRCGGDFETYSLGDSDAVVCGSCGYVGVSTDHTPEPAESETWEEALRRFRARDPETAETVELDGVEYRVPWDLADAIRDLTEKQRAVVVELLEEPDPANPDRTYAEIADAADVHRSYAGEVARSHGDLAAAIASCAVLE
ncbi:MAG: hypothetical protein ABEJ85_00265 [Haloarculaceae archaeon]